MEISIKNLFSDIEVRNIQLLSDGQLLTEDGYVFDIHRIALAESSRHFYELFCGNSGTDSWHILIPGVRGEVLYRALSYIYTGNFVCTEDTLIDLLIISERFLFNNLQQKLKEYIKKNISTANCVQILLASYHIKQHEIFQISFRFMQIHFEEIATSMNSKIEEMPVYVLKELLCSKTLCVKSEYIVWDVIVKWIEHEKLQRIVHMPHLLMCLKAADVRPELAFMITEHDIVAKNPFCKEINDMKSSGHSANNLQSFLDSFQANTDLLSNARHHRLPTNVHIFITTTTTSNPRKVYKDIYFTYDDNIDIWRKYKHLEKGHHFDINFIGNRVYLFDKYSMPGNLLIFNMADEATVTEPENEVLVHDNCFVMKHDGLIYTMGGWSDNMEELRNVSGRVQVYNPALNRWYDVAPMHPVIFISGVSLGNKIYVIGCTPDYLDNPVIIAQEYDPENNSWTLIASPKLSDPVTDLVTYRKKLLIFAVNSKSVEVYDPVYNCWQYWPDLPYQYTYPCPRVLQDQLIIHEINRHKYCWSTPMVRYNDELECWEPIEGSSPLCNLFKYDLYMVEDFETIKALTEDNRKMIASFEESPFHY